MTAALAELNDALADLDWVDITDRPAGAIRLTPLEAAPAPRNLRRVKNEGAPGGAARPPLRVLEETALPPRPPQAATSPAGTRPPPPETPSRLLTPPTLAQRHTS